MTIAHAEPQTLISEHTMPSWDGTPLFYRAWLPTAPAGRALLLFHRGHEHSGRYLDFVGDLDLHDTAVFAWDARGHGRSPGERGYADSFGGMVKDVDAFVRHVRDEHQISVQDMVLLGHSVAGVVVSAYVHDFAPPIRAMILATPAFRVKLYIPCALPALRLRMKFGGRPFIKSYVKGTMLTHDAAQAEAYARDPLVSRQIAVNILLGLQDAATRLLADAGAIRTPTLLLSAGSDWVVKNSAQKKFFNRLSSAIKQHVEYPGFYHSIFHEAGRAKPIAEVKRFIEGVFDTAPQSNPLLRADREGYTKREYDGLCRPLPIYSPKRLALAAQKVYLKTLGRLSAGIRLGWRRGFDSGQSLDYIYENRARGITAIGRLTDRIYLNTVGWRGIRQRKINLQNALRNAIARVREAGQVPRILDIAGGPGRYILDALKDLAGGSALALIRDQNTAALDAGRTLAAQMDLKNVTFAPGDAFDEQNLASLRPRFNIAIVSGLYELFPDNDPVLRSLRGLASAVERGGYLLYTNQPWHPQVEMIARVLTNREQKPWIMRRRTQAEMDELVRSAGFEKLSMAIDEDGIFTVSTARRAAP